MTVDRNRASSRWSAASASCSKNYETSAARGRPARTDAHGQAHGAASPALVGLEHAQGCRSDHRGGVREPWP
ncbi:MAG: hypothetical protein MZV49_16900 [Rhodopseudomonas palustris]|nr:hypothetical protein [Rhodopseudomonas palustris]